MDLAGLKITVNRKDLKPAISDLKLLSSQAKNTERNTDSLSSSFINTNGQLKNFTNGLGVAKIGLAGLATAGTAAVALVVGMGKQLIDIGEKYAGVNNRLKLVTDSQSEYNRVQEELATLANETRTELTTTIDLYSKLTRNTKELNLSEEQRIRLTETLNKAAVVSGASQDEQNNALRQFMQSLQGGIMRAEEYNSVIEQTPRIMEAVADGLGVTIGQLRTMVNEGELTTDVLLNGLAKGAKEVDSEFNNMSPTIEQAKIVLSNTWENIVNGANESSGATKNIAGMFMEFANTIENNKEGIVSAFEAIAGSINYGVDRISAFGNAFALFNEMRKGNVGFWDWVTADTEDAKALLKDIAERAKESEEAFAGLKDQAQDVSKTEINPVTITPKNDDNKSFDEVIQALNDEKLQIELSSEEYKEYLAIKKAGVDVNSAEADSIRKSVQEIENLKKAYENDNSASKVISDLEEENRQITSTQLEYKIYNNLTRAGVDAHSELGKQIVEQTRRNQRLADAMNAVNSNQRILIYDIESLNEILPVLRRRFKVSENEIEEWKQELESGKNVVIQFAKTYKEALREDLEGAVIAWGQSFQSTLNNMVWGAKTSFGDILKSFAQMITEMIIKYEIVQPLLSSVLGKPIGSFATGGAFVNGVQKFATGGVVSSPTLFPMAKGIGLMGEAGAEAILPLTRIGGDLGVKAELSNAGNGTPNVQVNVINNTGSKISENIQTEFNGKDFVITTVLESVSQNKGGSRDALKSMLR